MTQLTVTDEAIKTLQSLKLRHGDLLLHISGGCCDGTVVMCLLADEFLISDADRLMGFAGSFPVYMHLDQAAYFEFSILHIGVEPGRGAGFSLESTIDMRLTLHTAIATDV